MSLGSLERAGASVSEAKETSESVAAEAIETSVLVVEVLRLSLDFLLHFLRLGVGGVRSAFLAALHFLREPLTRLVMRALFTGWPESWQKKVAIVWIRSRMKSSPTM